MTRGGILGWSRNVNVQQPNPVLSSLELPSTSPSLSNSPSTAPSISSTPTIATTATTTAIQKQCDSTTLNFWSDGDPQTPYCSYHPDNDCPVIHDSEDELFEFADDVIKAKCAIGVCQAAGFDTGDFLDTTAKNFCAEDSNDLVVGPGTNDWFYLVDKEGYAETGAVFVDIVAVCCNN